MSASGNAGSRLSEVKDLKILKSPEEGGTKKDYQDFLDKIENHVTMAWDEGADIGQILSSGELPDIDEPEDITDEDEKSKLKQRLWILKVDAYVARDTALKGNVKALYALMTSNFSKMTKSKVQSKMGYSKANKANDAIWLLETVEDIMINFEETKPKTQSLDDQMETIMTLRQGDESNADFIKLVTKELKVYEKHGGDFLWGKPMNDDLDSKLKMAKDLFKVENNGTEMPDDDLKEKKRLLKRGMKEYIVAMAVLKRADPNRYGALQQELRNDFLLGNDHYPETIPDMLKLLDNYKNPNPVPATNRGANAGRGDGRATGVSFLQTANGTEVKFLRGTNDSFYPDIECNKCKCMGHYMAECPVARDNTGASLPGGNNRRNRNRGGRGGRGGRGNGAGRWTLVDHGGGGTASGAGNGDTATQGAAGGDAATGGEVSLKNKGGILMNQHNISHINPKWILLDSESTDHIFQNESFLTDVKSTTDGEMLRLHTSGGILDTYQKGHFGGLTVWYNPKCLANILSLALVAEQYRVTMDTDIENAFTVHISERHVMKFTRVSPGLYLFDASNVDMSKLRNAFSFLNTVSDNKKLFRARDVRKADDAVRLNRRTNHIAKDKFAWIVSGNKITNNPITVGDVNRSKLIYGPPLPPIKGRTRYQESPRVDDVTIIQLPKALHEDLKNVTLCIDFHYVNEVTVFHSISRRIDYRTVSFPLSRSKATIINELKDIYKIYNARGFKITDIHADNEFHKIQNEALPARLHLCGTDDHVPEIERSVQTQKNENRSVCHAMPYKCLPRIMVRELIKQGNAFLNAFGSKDGIGDGLTPRNIIDNLPHIDFNDLKYEFGQYVQLHIQEKITNTMKSRTIGAIVLGPREIRGRYNYMSLETGAQIDGRVVAEMPLTVEVIERVEYFGLKQSQPFRTSKMLKYEWRPGTTIGNEDVIIHLEDVQGNDDNIVPDPVLQEIQPAGPNPFVVNPVPVAEGLAPQGADINDFEEVENEEQQQLENEERQHNENQGAQNENQGAQDFVGEPQNLFDEPSDGDEGADSVSSNSNTDSDISYSDESSSDEEPATRAEERERRGTHFNTNTEEHGRGKRNTNPNPSYSFLQTKFEHLEDTDKQEYFHTGWKEYQLSGDTKLLERYCSGFLFAQMSAKKGIKKYGREAELKLIAEFKQLMEYKTFHGRKANELTREQKKGAANMINLIEEKINRGHTDDNPVIKARSCYNGRVQRGLYTKEETASPTSSIDSFFITSIKDAYEKRDVAVTDIKGAYLNAKMIDEVIMRITGKEVDLFLEIDPSLAEFVVYENGVKVLYVQLDKALYGCVQSALLWYELYSSTLIDMGFELNPYDMCVANSMIDGKQCTIVWYVDDNKISHVDHNVVSNIIKKIEAKFGKMSQTRGKEHEFIGMNMKFTDDRKVKISMKKHVLKAINTFHDDITRDAATPATSYLFGVRESSSQLSEEKADNFHSMVAMLLFISRRCRLDIQTAVGFLTTRVSGPDQDDWNKLKRVLQYLRGTIDLVLTLGADDLLSMFAWVDVSYGVHNDCKSHTGGAISWGWGVLLTMCKKQKLNTKSSTEGEIVGVSDFLPNVIWARMFMEAQGDILKKNTLYQDNQSAMKIILNGRKSSGQKTKHMDNRYFWIKDRLASENIEVEYCPTEKMVADFFTKPLQGNLFRKFRDVVLGYKHITSLYDMTEQTLAQERVGKGEIDILRENINRPNANASDSPTKNVSWADVVKGK